MIRALSAVLLSITLSALPTRAPAEPGTDITDPALQQRIATYLAAHQANNDFMGEVLVADAENILARVVVGMADIEGGIEHREGDIYGVGSITKQFTGAALALLATRGSLTLDDPVKIWLPEFSSQIDGMETVTLRMLAQQEAGLPDYNDFSDYAVYSRRNLSLDEILDWIILHTDRVTPGQGYRYSNSHFAVLAKVIEEASGKPYREFMREEIFKPAGMQSSDHYRAEEIVVRRVSLYDPGHQGDLVNAPVLDNAMKLGSGSLYTTADDLLSWHRALLRRQVLDSRAQALYLEPSAHNYAMGINLATEPRSQQRFYDHDGKAPGIGAYYKRWLDTGQVLIVLSNVNSGVLNQMKTDLSNLIEGEKVEMPAKREYRAITDALLHAAPGDYVFPPGTPIRITQERGGLSLYWGDSGMVQHLAPLADSDWFLMGTRGDRVRFLLDPASNVTGLEYNWGSGSEFCERR